MAQVKALLDRQTRSPWQLLHWSEEVICSFLRHPSSHTQTPTHCIEWTSLVNLSSGSWLVPYELFCMCAQHMHTIPKYHSPFTPAAQGLSLLFSPHGSRWHTNFLFPCTHTHTHLPVGFEVTLTLTVWARVGFFSLRQVKLAVCQEFFSLFFFSACLSTHSLSFSVDALFSGLPHRFSSLSAYTHTCTLFRSSVSLSVLPDDLIAPSEWI